MNVKPRLGTGFFRGLGEVRVAVGQGLVVGGALAVGGTLGEPMPVPGDCAPAAEPLLEVPRPVLAAPMNMFGL